MKREEVEICPHCDNEITIQWNVEKDGYQISCPYCGNKIMLCDACKHSDDNPDMCCDWCEDYNCFRKPKNILLIKVLQKKIEDCYAKGIRRYDEIMSLLKKDFASRVTKTNHGMLKEKGLTDDILVFVPETTMTMLVTNEKEVCVVYVDSDAKVKVKEF